MKLFQNFLIGVGVVSLTVTAGSLIASAQKPSQESVTECLKIIEMQFLPAAEEVRRCGGTFQTSKYVSKAPVAQAPVTAPVKAPSKAESIEEETALYMSRATDLSKTSCALSKGYTASMTRMDLMASGNKFMRENGVSEAKQNEFTSLLVKCAETKEEFHFD